MFRSARRGACDERALVLVAVGIACEIQFDSDGYVVLVEAAERETALQQLWMYEQERSRRPPPPVELPPPLAGGWRGSVVVHRRAAAGTLRAGAGLVRRQSYAVGAMDPQRIRAGEWWRALTALTLHWDATHLLGNLAAGALLGISAAQVWGNARAWLLIGIAAVLRQPRRRRCCRSGNTFRPAHQPPCSPRWDWSPHMPGTAATSARARCATGRR